MASDQSPRLMQVTSAGCICGLVRLQITSGGYREGQKVLVHILQASKKCFPESLAGDVEFLSLPLCKICTRTF